MKIILQILDFSDIKDLFLININITNLSTQQSNIESRLRGSTAHKIKEYILLNYKLIKFAFCI